MSASGERHVSPAYQANSDSGYTEEEQEVNSLSLLLFSVGGVHFGIDADQIAGVATFEGGHAVDLFWFHEEMGYGDKFVEYHSPIVITVRSDDAVPCRLIIDSMEDISVFSCTDICLFPPLLEPLVLRRGLWGVLPRNDRVILLLDVQRLLQKKQECV